MSLHALPSIEARRRRRWQGVVCSLCGVSLSALIVTVAGLVLDGIRPEAEAAYCPLFAGWNVGSEPTVCGGMACVPIEPLVRRPAGSPVRPPGLAPPGAGRAFPFPAGGFEEETRNAGFRGRWDEGWGEAFSGTVGERD